MAPNRLPGRLPSSLNFPIVITVQTDGPTNFDTPAPVCFPNLPDPATGQPLDVTAGQQTFVDRQAVDDGLGGIEWKLEDASGELVFRNSLGSIDPGVQTLTAGGTYTLTVGDDTDDATGQYTFQIRTAE